MKKIESNTVSGPVKKTVNDLIIFSQEANKWLNSIRQRRQQKDPSISENAMPIESAIQQIGIDINKHFEKLNTLGIERNKVFEGLEAEYASNIKVIKGSQPGQITKEYTYDPANKFSDLEKILKEKDAEFAKMRQEIVNEEVEIVPIYASTVPNENILPRNLVSVFRGFVIRREYVAPGSIK